jgi:transcriptional regulator with XRE-family HTH domain
MCTLDKIKKLLSEQNKKQKDLTDYLGISKNAFTNWNLGLSQSYVKHISKIAEFFNVSTDYLLGTEKKPLSDNEEWLNNLYNMTKDLSESDRIALNGFIAGLKANRKP